MWGPTNRQDYDTLAAAISIHGPRVGADDLALSSMWGDVISIHGPRVGADCS